MSSKKMGLRRVGIVGLSTLVVTSMMTLTAATSFAAANAYRVIGPVPEVAQGAAAAPAASLTLEAGNSWVSGATQTFQIKPMGAANDCSTSLNIAKAVGFAALPTVAVTDPGVTNNVADTPPAFTKALTSSSPACAVAGVLDILTLALTNSSTGTAADTYLVTLSGITYKVGANAPVGFVDVATAGLFVLGPSPAQQTNANVADASFTNTARVAAQPGATGVSLGTQTFQEFTAGSHFPTGSTTMELTLNDGNFTAGITPTITVPAGYSVTANLATGVGDTTYSFTIAGPAIPIKATVTVSGLKADVGGIVGTRTLTETNFPRPVSVINVLEFGVSPDSRTGGAQRWDTAALLFDQNFGGFAGTPPAPKTVKAVLSSGLNFPDALSANYLAGKLHTGILLTATGWLSQAAKVSILSNCISTVYITGETAAVSQATQDEVEALHVCNGPAISSPHVVVVRLGGADRFATNQLVNEYNFAPSDTVLMTSGLNFPDALSVGPVAAGRQMPLIITRGTTLGTEENAQLSDFSPTNIVIAGGTAVVSQAIQNDLVSRGFKVFRLGGADRTLTAALVAQWATKGFNDGTGSIIDNGLGFGTQVTYVATGSVFADALAAGPVAAFTNTGFCNPGFPEPPFEGGCGSVIVLTGNSTVLSAGIPSYLGNLTVGGDVSILHALGLTAALSSSVMQSAAASIDLLN